MMQGKSFLLSYLILMGLGKQCLADEEYFPEVDGWLRLHIVPLTWPDARLRCQQEGGVLASPTSNALTTALMKMMNASIMKDRSVFIGLQNSVFKGDFTSINGVRLSGLSLKWAEGLPNSADNAEDCLVMTDAGELADVSCDSLHPYFCYIKTHNPADEGFVLEPRTLSWYKFVFKGHTWPDAEAKCLTWGGHLAVINSDLESQVLKELFAKYPTYTIQGADDFNYVHLGFIDKTNQNKGWVISHGGETLSKSGFTTWDANEPNNPNIELCGSMQRNGLLNDISCEKKVAFICEIENSQCLRPYNKSKTNLEL